MVCSVRDAVAAGQGSATVPGPRTRGHCQARTVWRARAGNSSGSLDPSTGTLYQVVLPVGCSPVLACGGGRAWRYRCWCGSWDLAAHRTPRGGHKNGPRWPRVGGSIPPAGTSALVASTDPAPPLRSAPGGPAHHDRWAQCRTTGGLELAARPEGPGRRCSFPGRRRVRRRSAAGPGGTPSEPKAPHRVYLDARSGDGHNRAPGKESHSRPPTRHHHPAHTAPVRPFQTVQVRAERKCNCSTGFSPFSGES